MMPTAKRVATWRTEHSKRALVEKLDFVTAAGNLQTVVTPIAVLQKRNGRLVLESWNPQVTRDEVVQRTGFLLDTGMASETAPPTARERTALADLDPDGAFAAEVNG
jgi:glutaconate CoA-transferase subunit B